MLQLSHKNLDVYKISLKLVEEVINLTKQFPKEEQYVLVSQIRRAAVSVISNLAEGASRKSRKEKKRFYEISRGSLVEMDTQFEVSILLKYLECCQVNELSGYIESTFRMLSKMIENLRKPPLATSQTPLAK